MDSVDQITALSPAKLLNRAPLPSLWHPHTHKQYCALYNPPPHISEPAPADTLRLAIRHSPSTLHSSTNRVTCPRNHTLTKANATSSTDATNDPNARHKTKNADAGTGTVRQCSSAIDLYHVFLLQASLGCQNHSRVVHRLENTGKDNSDKSF